VLTAEDIMTPRTVMVALQADTTVAQAYELRDRSNRTATLIISRTSTSMAVSCGHATI